MPDITWGSPFCAEGSSCFRLGTDADGNGYIAVAGQEERPLTDDHLLQGRTQRYSAA
ncbi:hypothetical protein [Streptomyces werraensis]|uniref:hypothetical protein n=1 Tax=Streptomyces werraensis TaxID=68284 RepID=UPI003414EAD2